MLQIPLGKVFQCQFKSNVNKLLVDALAEVIKSNHSKKFLSIEYRNHQDHQVAHTNSRGHPSALPYTIHFSFQRSRASQVHSLQTSTMISALDYRQGKRH